MRTISREYLKERGFKKGDIYYKDSNDDHAGWRLILTDDLCAIGLNSEMSGSWSSSVHADEVSKIILTENLHELTYLNDVSRFFKTFDERLVDTLICQVEDSHSYEAEVELFKNPFTIKINISPNMESELNIGDIIKFTIDNETGKSTVGRINTLSKVKKPVELKPEEIEILIRDEDI